jgi:hypothetical protein
VHRSVRRVRAIFVYNLTMLSWNSACLFVMLYAVSLTFPVPLLPQQPPPASAARILLLPERIVSGEAATLAVLDVYGRLTPGVTVNFSNGDHLVTNVTGRALFVAPLNPRAIYATIALGPTRVYTTILRPAEAGPSSLQVSSAPRFASLADRFGLSGSGFCGDADANTIRVAGKPALVLAASPVSLVALPPAELEPGPAVVDVACAKRSGPSLSITFVELSLAADSSPLVPGEQRTLTVHVRGTTSKVGLEAHNLAPEVADLTGGNPARVTSTGGADNVGHFQLVGRQHGTFLISIHLLPGRVPPRGS